MFVGILGNALRLRCFWGCELFAEVAEVSEEAGAFDGVFAAFSFDATGDIDAPGVDVLNGFRDVFRG